MRRRRVRRFPRSRTSPTGADLGATFVGAIGWEEYYWAEGTEFTALGLADGAAVTTWPDEIGTRDWGQSTAADKPTYRAAAARFANRPCVDADGNDYMTGSAWGLTQPFSVVAICAIDTSSLGSTLLSLDGTTNGQPSIGEFLANISVAADQGPIGQAFSAATVHLVVAYYNDNTGFAEVDGARTTGDVGAGNPAGTPSLFTLATALDTSDWAGELAFLGGVAGDVTTHAAWGGFKAWARAHYGIASMA